MVLGLVGHMVSPWCCLVVVCCRSYYLGSCLVVLGGVRLVLVAGRVHCCHGLDYVDCCCGRSWIGSWLVACDAATGCMLECWGERSVAGPFVHCVGTVAGCIVVVASSVVVAASSVVLDWPSSPFVVPIVQIVVVCWR